jgi:hypothetical protein
MLPFAAPCCIQRARKGQRHSPLAPQVLGRCPSIQLSDIRALISIGEREHLPGNELPRQLMFLHRSMTVTAQKQVLENLRVADDAFSEGRHHRKSRVLAAVVATAPPDSASACVRKTATVTSPSTTGVSHTSLLSIPISKPAFDSPGCSSRADAASQTPPPFERDERRLRHRMRMSALVVYSLVRPSCIVCGDTPHAPPLSPRRGSTTPLLRTRTVGPAIDRRMASRLRI